MPLQDSLVEDTGSFLFSNTQERCKIDQMLICGLAHLCPSLMAVLQKDGGAEQAKHCDGFMGESL